MTTHSYPSDVTDKQWHRIKKHFDVGNYGNRQKWEKRTLVNAVLYILYTGCQWSMLPHDFPPYPTVWSFYRRACKSGIWEAIMTDLVAEDRMKQGRNADPSFGIIDSQSVKTVYSSEKRGIDGGKK